MESHSPSPLTLNFKIFNQNDPKLTRNEKGGV